MVPGKKGEGLHLAEGRSQARSAPLPAVSPESILPVSAQLYFLSLFICFSLPILGHPCLVSSLQGRLAGVSLSLLCPLRPAPSSAPARPASKPSEATSILNPKSCQLNRCLQLRLLLLLLTSGEPAEARPPPTWVGCGKATAPSRPPPSPPPHPPTPVIGLSAHSQASCARSECSPSEPQSHPASHSESPTYSQTPQLGPLHLHPTPRLQTAPRARLTCPGAGVPLLRSPCPQLSNCALPEHPLRLTRALPVPPRPHPARAPALPAPSALWSSVSPLLRR